MFAATKLIAPFLTPVGLVIVGLLLALLLSFTRFRRLSRLSLAACLVVMLVASLPVVARTTARLVESRYPPVAVADSPTANVIVLLGGATDPAVPPRQDVELNSAADRIMHAADLFRSGKAPFIIATGGNWKWTNVASTEAEQMRSVLLRFGVPDTAIVLEPNARNTAENAEFSAQIMREHGWTTALLVTSGVHMTRALAAFDEAGVKATASSTDIAGTQFGPPGPLDWLPSADAMAQTTENLHEWVGDIYYRVRGWS